MFSFGLNPGMENFDKLHLTVQIVMSAVQYVSLIP